MSAAKPVNTTPAVSWPSRQPRKPSRPTSSTKGEELVFTHSIFRLCDLAAQYDPAFRDIREQVKLLDFYYVEVIPAEFYSDRDAEQAIAMARIIIESVQARMSLESGPAG